MQKLRIDIFLLNLSHATFSVYSFQTLLWLLLHFALQPVCSFCHVCPSVLWACPDTGRLANPDSHCAGTEGTAEADGKHWRGRLRASQTGL